MTNRLNINQYLIAINFGLTHEKPITNLKKKLKWIFSFLDKEKNGPNARWQIDPILGFLKEKILAKSEW